MPDGRSRFERRCHSSEVRIERLERPEQLDRGLDQPAEEHDAEAEVRRRDGGRAVTRRAAPRRGRDPRVQPVVAMTKRRAAGLERGAPRWRRRRRRARPRRRGSRRRGRRDRAGRPRGRPSERGSVRAAGAGCARSGRGLDRAAERAVAEDEHRVHLVSLPRVEGRRSAEVQGMKKPRSPSWCRGPWSLRSLEAPVRRIGRAVRAPGPVPPGRAARASSWTLPRRCRRFIAGIVAHNGELMQTFLAERACGLGSPPDGADLRPSRPGDTHRPCPIAVTVREALAPARAARVLGIVALVDHRLGRRPGLLSTRPVRSPDRCGRGRRRGGTDRDGPRSECRPARPRRPARPGGPTARRIPDARLARPRRTRRRRRGSSGYRWPLPQGPADPAVRPDGVGLADRRRRAVPRRHRPRDVLRRPDRGRPRRRRPRRRPPITTTRWAGSAT